MAVIASAFAKSIVADDEYYFTRLPNALLDNLVCQNNRGTADSYEDL